MFRAEQKGPHGKPGEAAGESLGSDRWGVRGSRKQVVGASWATLGT